MARRLCLLITDLDSLSHTGVVHSGVQLLHACLDDDGCESCVGQPFFSKTGGGGKDFGSLLCVSRKKSERSKYSFYKFTSFVGLVVQLCSSSCQTDSLDESVGNFYSLAHDA